MTQYISYLRVSTAKQGYDGLGIEAQRAAVSRFIRPEDKLVKEFVEVESGTKGSDIDRPVLSEALAMCRVNDYTLIVAKIDRLYRNVLFTAKLLESKTKFVCCDMPFADNLTIYIFAALAEWEAARISERTKSALKFVKENGSKSGIPVGGVSSGSSLFQKVSLGSRYEKARRDPMNRLAFAMIEEMKKNFNSSEKIANKLNQSGYRCSNGSEFTSIKVNTLYKVFTSKRIQDIIDFSKANRQKMADDISAKCKAKKKRVLKELETRAA